MELTLEQKTLISIDENKYSLNVKPVDLHIGDKFIFLIVFKLQNL